MRRHVAQPVGEHTAAPPPAEAAMVGQRRIATEKQFALVSSRTASVLQPVPGPVAVDTVRVVYIPRAFISMRTPMAIATAPCPASTPGLC